MGKTMKASEDAGGDGESLERMPIASSILNSDNEALIKILQKDLFQRAEVLYCTVQQTDGHAFTGGRSTPVYRITCQIRRRKDGVERTRHFIAKLVQMKPQDLKRRESYASERRFYDHPELADWFRNQHNLALPRLLVGDRDGKAPYQTVCWVMDDLSMNGYPRQSKVLSIVQAKAALSWLAKFHALGWNDEHHLVWKQGILHARGGFWTLASCHTNDTQQIPSQWKSGIQKLLSEGLLDSTHHTRLVRLGHRLHALCQTLPDFLNQQCAYYGTWIHGDFKAANLLFKEETESFDDGELSTCVAVVDFQFTGWGICAEDVAYLMYPDAQGSLMDSVNVLLDHYHEQLMTNIMLLMKGGPSSMTRDVLERLYDLAKIDMTRYWLNKGWEATTEGEAQMVLRIESALDAIDGGAVLENQPAYLKALQSYLGGT
jgi:hypothetical protein